MSMFSSPCLHTNTHRETLTCLPEHPFHWGIGRARLVERRTHDRKVVSSITGRSGGRMIFSRVYFLCLLLFSVGSNSVLPQWHVKDPAHFALSAVGKLHLNTRTPLTQRSRHRLSRPSRQRVGTYRGGKAHMQLREHSTTVVSARLATVDWSWSE